MQRTLSVNRALRSFISICVDRHDMTNDIITSSRHIIRSFFMVHVLDTSQSLQTQRLFLGLASTLSLLRLSTPLLGIRLPPTPVPVMRCLDGEASFCTPLVEVKGPVTRCFFVLGCPSTLSCWSTSTSTPCGAVFSTSSSSELTCLRFLLLIP